MLGAGEYDGTDQTLNQISLMISRIQFDLVCSNGDCPGDPV